MAFIGCKCRYREQQEAGVCVGRAGRAPETRLRPKEAFLKSLRQLGATPQSSVHAWLTTEAPSAATNGGSAAATAGSQPRGRIARTRTAVTVRSQMARHRAGRPAVAPSDWRRGHGETRQLDSEARCASSSPIDANSRGCDETATGSGRSSGPGKLAVTGRRPMWSKI
jgi:hypothetical protein